MPLPHPDRRRLRRQRELLRLMVESAAIRARDARRARVSRSHRARAADVACSISRARPRRLAGVAELRATSARALCPAWRTAFAFEKIARARSPPVRRLHLQPSARKTARSHRRPHVRGGDARQARPPPTHARGRRRNQCLSTKRDGRTPGASSSPARNCSAAAAACAASRTGCASRTRRRRDPSSRTQQTERVGRPTPAPAAASRGSCATGIPARVVDGEVKCFNC